MQEVNQIYKGNQKLAVESTGINACVSAGAGTGKTFVLVRRFIRLLEENKAEAGEIAAITFTEKAAKEMKDRIRASCSEKHRRDLESARIGTIHSFCARLLRENPVEAGIDPKFRVLDEPEALSLTDKIVHKEILNLLDKENPDIVFILSEYSFKNTKNIIKALIKERIDIRKCAEQFMSMKDYEIMEYWKDIDKNKKEELIESITNSSHWTKAIQFLTEYSALDSSDILEERRKKILDLAEKDTLSTDEKAGVLLEIRRQCVRRGYRKKNWDGPSLKAVLEAIVILRKLLEPNIKYLENTPEELDLKAVRITRCLFGLYKKIDGAYTDYKKTEGLLDFNDLIINAKKLLKENKHIRRLYQASIRYLLVDEYQDTDFHQKEIIFYLVEETSLPPADNVNDIVLSNDKLFIVGDQKQSIYRFRGADVSVFEDTRRIFRKAGRNLDLDVSLRANPQNISFFNDFFGKVIGRERADKQDYEANYTDIASCRNINTDTPQLEFIAVKEEGLTSDESRHAEAELIARRIKRMVGSSEKLVYEKKGEDTKELPRNVEYKDIAVLFRAMTNVGIYEQVFRKYNIPYYIISGSGFFGRQEIKDILNYLKVLENTCDDIALAGLLRSPMAGVSDDTLYELRQKCKSLFSEIKDTKDNEKIALCRQTLSDLRKIKNRISIASLIEEIVRRTGYFSILITQFMGTQKISNVKKLIDTARRFEEKGLFTLGDFIKYIDEFVVSEVREGEAAIVEEESNVAKIMTIHKAKGLEFPVVFVPDISKSPYTGKKQLLYDRDFIGLGLKIKDPDGEPQDTIQRKWISYEDTQKELAESKRLLYVASTRAKDYLIYSGRLTETKNTHIWSGWFLYHYNLDKSGNSIVKLTDKVKARVTTEIPETEERQKPKPLLAQYNQKIRQQKELPCPKIQVDSILEQTEPITRFTNLKESFTATEFSDYIKCPRRYELRHITGVPEFQLQTHTSGISPVLLGTITHKFFEKWNLSEQEIPKLLINIEDKRYIEPLQNFIKTFKKNPIFKEIKEAGQIKNELAVTFRHNGYIIEGIIDKLYKTKTGWVILDYKTDDINKTEIPEKIKTYEIQLQIYALGINKILGITPERAIILFLSPGKAHTIKTDNAEENITRLINQIRKGKFHPASPDPLKCHCPYKWVCENRNN